MAGTTTNARPIRLANGDYERYLSGRGIDIGGGYDPLSDSIGRPVEVWDKEQGDAVEMRGCPVGTFDFVYSSHCLEHLTDPRKALVRWASLLKSPDKSFGYKGGYLFVCVPDWDLYEQGVWPSRFNGDHKWTFSATKTRGDVRRNNHINVFYDIVPLLLRYNVEFNEVRIEDYLYDYEKPMHLDQTGDGLAQICFIGEKFA